MNRTRLRRKDVVQAAIAYIDEYGVQSLTMRRLGTTLDVEAMALYRHVSSREELVSAAVRELIDGLFDDELMQSQPKNWEAYFQHVANAMRNLALSHPRMFPLLISQPPEAPWLRPPLRSIRWVDYFLASLLGYGFSETHAVKAYKAFTSFLLGDLLLQVTAMGIDIVPVAGDGDESEEDPAEYATVRRLESKLSEDLSQREVSDGLDDLIERIRTVSEL